MIGRVLDQVYVNNRLVRTLPGAITSDTVQEVVTTGTWATVCVLVYSACKMPAKACALPFMWDSSPPDALVQLWTMRDTSSSVFEDANECCADKKRFYQSALDEVVFHVQVSELPSNAAVQTAIEFVRYAVLPANESTRLGHIADGVGSGTTAEEEEELLAFYADMSDLGHGDALEGLETRAREGKMTPMLVVLAGELVLEHAAEYVVLVRLCDALENCRDVRTMPLFIDTTPPLRPPRIFSDFTKKRYFDNRTFEQWFTHAEMIRPSWPSGEDANNWCTRNINNRCNQTDADWCECDHEMLLERSGLLPALDEETGELASTTVTLFALVDGRRVRAVVPPVIEYRSSAEGGAPVRAGECEGILPAMYGKVQNTTDACRSMSVIDTRGLMSSQLRGPGYALGTMYEVRPAYLAS